jgi:peptidoglycan lytic transglycosylase
MGTVSSVRGGRAASWATIAAACLAIAGCASSDKLSSRIDPKYGVSSSPRLVDFGDPVPKGGGVYRLGKPYSVAGRMYVPEEDIHYRAEGLASWYGDDFHGRQTANGEIFDMTALTAAHPTLPMPCYVRVTNVRNGKSVILRVNDRGPYHGNRLIDVSTRAAKLLEFDGYGVARVRVEYVGRAPLEGTDDRLLEATLRTGVPAPAPSAVMVASARPFVPEAAAPVGRVRGNVPIPEGRPYTLGSTSSDLASLNATSEMSASRRASVDERVLFNPRAVTYDNPTDDISNREMSRPVSAYAPVRSAPNGPVTGRGLY